MTKYISALVMGLFLITACKGEEEGVAVPPLFVESVPANGADNVALTSEVSVTFDEVVTLAVSHGITVNGQPAEASVQFTKLKITVALEPGTLYTVVIPAGAVVNTQKAPLREKIEFSFSTKDPVNHAVKADLAMPDPSPEAVRVYNFLKDNYGLKVISGAMANVSWNTNEAQWIYSKTGKYPALNGFDLIHLYASPANWINYEDITILEDWWQNNGLISMMWHWNVPKEQGGNEFAFYTDQTVFDIREAVKDGTWQNDVIRADMAKVAVTMKMLQAKNIPVIWRPLHEAAGGWFWWGAHGAEPCKALWQMMFDFFKAEGINNLIWVWTVETNDDAWYPGDEYVDMIGRDLYHKPDASWIAAEYEALQAKYPDKIVALSECGSVAGMTDQITAGATWSFFMPWYDYNRTLSTSGSEFANDEHEHANAAWWVGTMANPKVLTRDEMPNLKE